MSLTINHQTNDISASSGSMTIDGSAIGGGGGGTEFIVSSGDISNAATVAFTQFDASKYDSYKFILNYVKPVTDNAELRYRTSSDGGSSYDSGGATYKEGASSYNYGHIGATVGNDTNENGFSGLVDVFSPHKTVYTSVIVRGTWMSNAGAALTRAVIGTLRASNADVDAIQFYFSSGNITSGEVIMLGIVNS